MKKEGNPENADAVRVEENFSQNLNDPSSLPVLEEAFNKGLIAPITETPQFDF